MLPHRRQRDGDEDDVTSDIATTLVPYDPKLLESIESSFKTRTKTARDRTMKFETLGAAISLNAVKFKSIPVAFASGWDTFTACILEHAANPLRVVAAAVILINNNNNGSTADGKTYGFGFFGLADTSIRSDDDGSFPEDLVTAWNQVINQFQDTLSFASFPRFASARCVKSVIEYPICKHTQILSRGENLKPLHNERFLDCGGIWINSSSFLRQTSSSPANNAASTTEDLSLPEHPILATFASNVPNFIGGESGSGKTCAAMIAGANAIILYSTALFGGKRLDVDSPFDDVAATKRFVSLIAGCLALECPAGNTTPAPRFANSTGHGWQVPWGNKLHDKRILVVLDEFVRLENLRRCFIRCWPSFRTWLQKLVCCASADQIYLVVLGTSTENLDESVGSLSSYCRVFTVRAPRLFADLLHRQVRADSTTSTTQRMFARHLLTLLYDKRTVTHEDSNTQKVVFLPRPSDPSTYRFLQLVSNPRCAALAVKQVELTAAMLNEATPCVSVSAVLSYLPSWSNNIARNFGSMNGLAEVARTPKEKLDLIGAALYVVLTNAATLTTEQREVLSNKTGLLADTGFWMNEAHLDEKEYEKVPNVTRDLVPAGPKWSKTERHVYVFANSMPLFVMSKACVALYLLGAGSILSSGCSIVGADWNPFAAATADYIMLCWLLNVPAPNPASFVETRSGNKSMPITYPAAAFALRNSNNHGRTVSKVYRGILQYALKDESLIDETDSNPERKRWFQDKKIQWKTMITQEKAGFIFENISNTAFADLIAISEGRITLVQCKHYSTTTLSSEATNAAFDNMVNENMLVLEFLAECAGATKKSPCELVVVLAVDEPKSFNDDTKHLFVNRKWPNLKSKFIGSFSAKIITVFPSCTSNDNNTPSFMFPVLQYPSDDHAAMKNAAIGAVPGQEFVSEHAVLNTSSQEVCARFLQKLQKESKEDGAQK